MKEVERGEVVVVLNCRRFTTESEVERVDDIREFTLPDGTSFDFNAGYVARGPSRWIEINSQGEVVSATTESAIRAYLVPPRCKAAPWWKFWDR